MNRREAKALMLNGIKITHENFGKEEWMIQHGMKITLEDGVCCYEEEFWADRTHESWNDGYSIWKEEILVGENDGKDMFLKKEDHELQEKFLNGNITTKELTEGHYHVRKPFVREDPKIGNNWPCPCNSGLKYKKCCK